VSNFAMNIRRVFAIVLFAASSVATAQPKPKEDTGRISYNEKIARQQRENPQDGWVQLATPTPANHGTEFVVVGKDAGEFDQLRIAPSSGTVIVRRVKIYFDDGKQKIVDVDKIINAERNNAALIELDSPKPIDRVVITTEPQTRGSYALFGAIAGGVARR
jgi:hypothetical protein